MSEGMSAADLEALGIYDSISAQADAFARVLVLGPAKLGKTTAIARTAPKPLILNCDGLAATKGAAAMGAKFKALDVNGCASWRQGCTTAKQLAESGVIKTIIVDTITLLADNLEAEIGAKFEGFELWKEHLNTVMRGIRFLISAPAHLFVIAHMLPGYSDDEGILPAISGQAKQRLPAIMHDTVLFTYDEDREPQRMFAVGPQGSWRYGCRNVRQSCQIPADVGVLFETLGINP